MKKVNICLGRFQPFTAGHYKCVEAAWKAKHLPTVICMINVSAAKVDKRHPFPSEMLVEAYNDLFSSDSKIMEVIPVRSADIVTIGKTLAASGYEIGSWTCGTDRIDDYTRMSTKYGEKAGLADDFEMIEVPRTDEDISATKARTCLLNDDRDAFYALMPQGSASSLSSLFDTLKDQINIVYGNSSESRIRRFGHSTNEHRVSRLRRYNEATVSDTRKLFMDVIKDFRHDDRVVMKVIGNTIRMSVSDQGLGRTAPYFDVTINSNGINVDRYVNGSLVSSKEIEVPDWELETWLTKNNSWPISRKILDYMVGVTRHDSREEGAEELMDALALEFDRNAMNLDQEGDSDFYGFPLEYRGIRFWIAVDLTTNKVRVVRENDCNMDVAVDLGFGDDEDDAYYEVWASLIDLAVSESKPVANMTKQDVRPMLATYYNSLLAVAKRRSLTADDLVSLFKNC